MYVNISYSKELIKEGTQLMPRSSPFPCLCGGDQLQVWVGVLAGEICNLIYTRMHIEVQALSQYLRTLMGFHLHHCQHTKLYAGAWNSLEVV